MRIPVHFLDEASFDRKQESGEFFRFYEKWELPDGWEDISYELAKKLQSELDSHYAGLAWVNDEAWPSYSKYVEVTLSEINLNLFRLLLGHLEKESTECILITAYSDLSQSPSIYKGRIALRETDITIETACRNGGLCNMTLET